MTDVTDGQKIPENISTRRQRHLTNDPKLNKKETTFLSARVFHLAENDLSGAKMWTKINEY